MVMEVLLSSWELHEEKWGQKVTVFGDRPGWSLRVLWSYLGALKGIQDDLLMDEEVGRVRFSSSMLEWFDEIQKGVVLKFGEVTFI